MDQILKGQSNHQIAIFGCELRDIDRTCQSVLELRLFLLTDLYGLGAEETDIYFFEELSYYICMVTLRVDVLESSPIFWLTGAIFDKSLMIQVHKEKSGRTWVIQRYL